MYEYNYLLLFGIGFWHLNELYTNKKHILQNTIIFICAGAVYCVRLFRADY